MSSLVVLQTTIYPECLCSENSVSLCYVLFIVCQITSVRFSSQHWNHRVHNYGLISPLYLGHFFVQFAATVYPRHSSFKALLHYLSCHRSNALIFTSTTIGFVFTSFDLVICSLWSPHWRRERVLESHVFL